MAIHQRGHCPLTSHQETCASSPLLPNPTQPTRSLSISGRIPLVLVGWEWRVSWRGISTVMVPFVVTTTQTGRPKTPQASCHKIREKEIIQCLPLLLRAPGQAAQIPVDDRACGPKLISISDYRRRDQANISPLIPMHDASCGVDPLRLDRFFRSVAKMTITGKPISANFGQLISCVPMAIGQNKRRLPVMLLTLRN